MLRRALEVEEVVAVFKKGGRVERLGKDVRDNLFRGDEERGDDESGEEMLDDERPPLKVSRE